MSLLRPQMSYFQCSRVRTTVSRLVFAERIALAGLCGHTRSDRYFGASPCTALYVNTRSLTSILCDTGINCTQYTNKH